MKRPQIFLILIVMTALLFALVSCAPAAESQPGEPEAQPTLTVVELLPTITPLTEPTQVIPSPGAWVEQRMLELEYPSQMHKGDSDVLRLSLIFNGSGYTATTEFEDHTLDVQEIPLEYLPGYRLAAAARLDGAGFTVSPEHEYEQTILPGTDVTWHWSLNPQNTGRHRLSVVLLLRWYAEDNPGIPLREEQVLSQALEIRVSSFLGLGRVPTLLGSLLGLLLGSGLSLATLLFPRQELPTLQIRQPNPRLVIEPAPGMNLPATEAELLRALFQRYARLTLAGEFLSGYSGANTYLALPITPGGQSDAPTIVKIGPRQAIQQEYANYQHFVKDRLPPITARIQHPPVVLRGQDLAAMQYTFIAKPGQNPVSLRLALLQNPQPELLTALFETFGPSWWMQRETYTFRPAQEYDRLLPPHYVLRPLAAPQGAPRLTLDENIHPFDLALQAGNIVRVGSFKRFEMRADHHSLTLIGNSGEGHPPIRLRWLSTQAPRNTLAVVDETQSDLFSSYIRGFNRFGLPDPLERLAEILVTPIQGTRSVIHGDLNLENVLVGPGGLIWLIDFAQTRTGHPLFDFSRLGAELIAHILAKKNPSPYAYLQSLQSMSDPLWLEVNQIARRCLFNQSQPREMEIAQYLACLGALKFNNLSSHSRHCLYLTAAEIGARL